MSFDPDLLLDRRRLKRRLRIWQLLAVIAAAAAIFVWLHASDRLLQRPYIARLHVTGLIVQDDARNELLADIAEDRRVRALIVHIDSPGGTVVGGEDLYKGLRKVAEHKPVIAVMGTIAASAGYMVAIASDRIYAREGTITGSIGVLFQTADVTRLLDTIGVTPETVKSGPLKGAPSPLEPMTDEVRAATRGLVEDMYEMFVNMVIDRRPLTPSQALGLADGRVYTGRQAAANGLIDAIGDETAAREWLAEAHGIGLNTPLRRAEGEERPEFWRDLLNSLSGKSLFSNALSLDGLVSVWQPDAR